MLESLKNIFANNEIDQDEKNNDLDILTGLMVEAANTDGVVTQDELDKISSSLVNIFKEDPKFVQDSLSKAHQNKDNSHSLYYYNHYLFIMFQNSLIIIWWIYLNVVTK